METSANSKIGMLIYSGCLNKCMTECHGVLDDVASRKKPNFQNNPKASQDKPYAFIKGLIKDIQGYMGHMQGQTDSHGVYTPEGHFSDANPCLKICH